MPPGTGQAFVGVLLVISLAMSSCKGSRPEHTSSPRAPEHAAGGADSFAEPRAAMVRDQIEARGVRDSRVLEAMRRVPRHRFVPSAYRASAYDDSPLPIGNGQTISQPYIVAWMTEALRVTPESRVLEVGTGSGYQAAVLGEIARDIYTIELVPELARRAAEVLDDLQYRHVHIRTGDGYRGWPEHAPFDGIIVTAAPDHVPQPLVDQLRVGARLVIPVGRDVQRLTIVTKTATGTSVEAALPVRFVPLVRPDR